MVCKKKKCYTVITKKSDKAALKRFVTHAPMRFVTNAPILKIFFYFSIKISQENIYFQGRETREKKSIKFTAHTLQDIWQLNEQVRQVINFSHSKSLPRRSWNEITSFNTFHNDLMLFWKSFVTNYIHLHALDDEMLLKEISNVHLKTYPICDLVISFTVNPHPYF